MFKLWHILFDVIGLTSVFEALPKLTLTSANLAQLKRSAKPYRYHDQPDNEPFVCRVICILYTNDQTVTIFGRNGKL